MIVSASLFLSRDFLGESPVGKQAMKFSGNCQIFVLFLTSTATVEGGRKIEKSVSAECLMPSRNYEDNWMGSRYPSNVADIPVVL